MSLTIIVILLMLILTFRDIVFLLLVQVDELMKQELANWKLAVDKEKSGKVKGAAKVQ